MVVGDALAPDVVGQVGVPGLPAVDGVVQHEAGDVVVEAAVTVAQADENHLAVLLLVQGVVVHAHTEVGRAALVMDAVFVPVIHAAIAQLHHGEEAVLQVHVHNHLATHEVSAKQLAAYAPQVHADRHAVEERILNLRLLLLLLLGDGTRVLPTLPVVLGRDGNRHCQQESAEQQEANRTTEYSPAHRCRLHY